MKINYSKLRLFTSPNQNSFLDYKKKYFADVWKPPPKNFSLFYYTFNQCQIFIKVPLFFFFVAQCNLCIVGGLSYFKKLFYFYFFICSTIASVFLIFLCVNTYTAKLHLCEKNKLFRVTSSACSHHNTAVNFHIFGDGKFRQKKEERQINEFKWA